MEALAATKRDIELKDLEVIGTLGEYFLLQHLFLCSSSEIPPYPPAPAFSSSSCTVIYFAVASCRQRLLWPRATGPTQSLE